MSAWQDPDNPRDIFTISRLNAEARDLLAAHFPLIWVEGELSNLARPASGHLYFSLKDARAQIRCALFKGRNRTVNFTPENGMQVLVRASVSLYEPRGDYQLIVEHMEEAGDGALRRAFEELKRRLDAEGLFDEAGKRAIPALPRRIGVITSPSGAAIRDILSVLKRRFPAIPVLVYPVQVQGETAAAQIAETIRLADERRDCDVLILARGGGSLEDLWSFNEEIVARAIHACQLPIVCGVGHEVDVSIADFVADRRAPTPSVAAEMVTPDRQDWLEQFRALNRRLTHLQRQQLTQARQRLDWLHRRLQQVHPGQRLRQQAQRLDDMEQRSQRALLGRLRHSRSRLDTLHARLQRHHPGPRLHHLQRLRDSLSHRLTIAMQQRLQHSRQGLTALVRELDTVSPLATLQRGYAIVSTAETGQILRRATDIQPGQMIRARLAEGQLTCEVTDIESGGDT